VKSATAWALVGRTATLEPAVTRSVALARSESA
jgi:hypothetical protein